MLDRTETNIIRLICGFTLKDTELRELLVF